MNKLKFALLLWENQNSKMLQHLILSKHSTAVESHLLHSAQGSPCLFLQTFPLAPGSDAKQCSRCEEQYFSERFKGAFLFFGILSKLVLLTSEALHPALSKFEADNCSANKTKSLIISFGHLGQQGLKQCSKSPRLLLYKYICQWGVGQSCTGLLLFLTLPCTVHK